MENRKKLKITYAAATHPGNIRSKNQDSYYIDGFVSSEEKSFVDGESDRNWFTAAVFDGVGGLDYGAEASHRASVFLAERDGPEIGAGCVDFARETNRLICEASDASDGEMGTTLAMITVMQDQITICNVGDSRIYRFRNGHLKQLSKDHTQLQHMIDEDLLDMKEKPEAAAALRHKLTQYLGVPESNFLISPFVDENADVQPGDIYILCSDGITDMADDDMLEDVLNRTKQQEPEEIVLQIMAAASIAGGEDNITVTVVKMD